ncbi:pirin family protein [Aneurinibacillus danicus]|uniref:Quercetin 2,3-dioxygenase n=1 Tax=Aneurinibacillus danicus TaxID=267746 RepID=A0A511V140_9BACL|nr:pirin family protein [Aneurinibacillus danicus]GEN32589.1 quercetin 2,3-dioxygenase [Aneurinibacillus danicus]
MITIYPAASRYSTNHGWLQSNFSFSFAEYYDPNNLQFGPLRVFNDDIVQPGTGFGSHPHREMEIVSIVLQGQLKHQDSTGNSEVLVPGEIQRMTAGTGIVHSEFNPSDTEDVNFLQLWFLPDEKGLKPSYEQFAYDQEALKNNLLPIVSKRQTGEHRVAHIHQDLTLYLSRLDADKTITFTQPEGRRIYVFVMEGELELNGEKVLQKRDAARINETPTLEVKAKNDTHFMLIDLP